MDTSREPILLQHGSADAAMYRSSGLYKFACSSISAAHIAIRWERSCTCFDYQMLLELPL